MLNRDELFELYKSNKGFITNNPDFEKFLDADHSFDNPFQPCSIDIHIGEIFVPESDSNHRGSALNPIKDEFALPPGSTLMVRTLEKFNLPANIGALCFSPSRLALKAILITNTGHVDPGYEGHLHFTAINMGKDYFPFRVRDVFITMLFFKLSNDAPLYGKEFLEEIQNQGATSKIPAAINRYFPKLSKDFLDIEKRARGVAKEEINKALFWQKVAGGLIAAIAIISPMANNWIYNNKFSTTVKLNEQKIEQIEANLDHEKRLLKLELNENTDSVTSEEE